MWAVLLMAAAAAGLLATEGRTPLQIEAVAAALLAVDDLNAAYASDNITFTLAAAWGDYDVDVVEASTNATAGGFVVLARPPPCDVGTAWNGTACEACPPGFTRVEGDACAPCAPGSFSDDRLLCEPCDEYSYQPAFAAASWKSSRTRRTALASGVRPGDPGAAGAAAVGRWAGAHPGPGTPARMRPRTARRTSMIALREQEEQGRP